MGNKDYKSVRHKYYNWILVLLVIVVNQETHGLESTTDVTVTTTEAASKYRCVPKDQSIPIGSNVTICCQLNDNSATSLMKGTFLILTGAEKSYWDQDQMARYKILGMGKLMITNVNERDDSAYGCSSNAGNIAFYITVQLPPDAPSVSSDESVYNSGENATLTCTSSGKPAPNIYWMSKNRRYMGVSAVNGRTTTNTLSIIVSREHNKQTFACYVYNDVNVGQPLQRTMIFDIRYPPYVRIKERINQDPFKVIEYTRMSLTCEVDANPPASKIKWMKNNEFLKDRTHSSSIDEFRLSQNVSKENNSRYECRAENTLGTESDSISVEVLYHPRVSVESDVEVTLHSHVILNCSADANPPASIKWIGKNHQIRNDNTFIISNVRVGDAGKYTCEAHNNLHSSTGMNKTGSAAAVTNLHVRYAPGSATLRLRGTSIKGQDIVLICDLPVNQVGYPPPSFKWRKLADNYLKETSNTLIISNSTLSNTGQYTCKARNIEGEGGTGSYYVKVKEYPEFQKKLNRILYLNITDPSPNLMCKVRGNPSPNVTWHKDGRPVSRFDYTVDHQKPQPHDNSFVVTSYLHFKNFTTNNVRKLRPSDTGNYSCVVTTLLNQTFELKSTLQIIIQSPPQPNKKNDIVAITLNENSSISIIVQAYPPPTFSWSKNNVALPFHIVFEKLGVNRYRSTLKIRSATRSDLGVYKCDVSNSYGSLVIRRDIRERSDPDPPRNLSSVDATWESVYLKWIPGFNGGEKQTFIISYSHDKKNYSVEVAAENTRYIYYNVTNLMPDTTYIFSVRGRSDLGTGRPSNSFSVHTIYLVLPSPENVRYIVAEKKISFEVKTDYECCTSLLIAKNGDDLKDLRCEPTVKRWKNNTVDLPNNEVEAVSVGLCLKRRNELCGNYIQAIKVEPNMSAGPLSTFHVIVIAVVCGIILIVLVVILILFLYWRSRSHKKQYGNEVNYPHISNGSVPNGIAGRQGYDNPDGPYSNGYVENTHNTSSEHTDELPPYTDQDMGQELSDESDLDKPYDPRHIDSLSNEMPPSYTDVCRGQPEKPGAMTFYNNPHITRNPNFISLNPEGMMPRDTSISGRESGYSTPDSTRPKKWYKRNDNQGPTYYSQVHQMPQDPSGPPCAMPCCMEDLRLESPKRSSCLPLFGLTKNTDRCPDHRRLLWNRPLLSTKNFSFPRLGTRHVQRKAVVTNSDKTEDKDLELRSCGIKPPKTKGKSQTLHFDFSRNESQDEEEDRNKSSETLLEDMPDITQQERNTFRRSRSTFMPIPQIAETQFNIDSVETETQISNEPATLPCSRPQFRTSPLVRRCSGKTITTAPPPYEATLSSIHTSVYQTSPSIYSSKYPSQVESYYATVQKPRSSVVSTVSSLQSSVTQFGSTSSIGSFSSPLAPRKNQPNLTSSSVSYSTMTTTSLPSPGYNISRYSTDPPTLSMYPATTPCEVTTARDTETKYADVTSLMTSKYPPTGNGTLPIRTQFNKLASQVAGKKYCVSKSILKNHYSGSQSSIETHSSTTHFPVYESIDDLKYIDDTSSESSSLMEQKIIRQESGRRSKLANPTHNNNSTHNNKNAVSLVL